MAHRIKALLLAVCSLPTTVQAQYLTPGGASPYCISQLVRDGDISCSDNCDFSNLDIRTYTMSLDYAHYDCVNFFGANLEGISMMEAELTDCNFHGANLKNVNMIQMRMISEMPSRGISGPSFRGASMSHVQCAGAIFDEARIEGYQEFSPMLFDNAHCPGATFFKTRMKMVSMTSGVFTDSDFFEARMEYFDVSGTDFSGRVTTFHKAKLKHIKAIKTTWEKADATYIEIHNSDLTCASFAYADLFDAHLASNNILAGVDFTGANMAMISLPSQHHDTSCPLIESPPPSPPPSSRPPPAPTTRRPPTSLPPSPLSANQCDPSKTCNVCDACCASYMTDSIVCDACVKTECPQQNKCQDESSCNVCGACCRAYITDGVPCDACVAAAC